MQTLRGSQFAIELCPPFVSQPCVFKKILKFFKITKLSLNLFKCVALDDLSHIVYNMALRSVNHITYLKGCCLINS